MHERRANSVTVQMSFLLCYSLPFEAVALQTMTLTSLVGNSYERPLER